MDSRMRRCAGVSCEVVSMPDTVAPVAIGRARSRTGTDPGQSPPQVYVDVQKNPTRSCQRRSVGVSEQYVPTREAARERT